MEKKTQNFDFNNYIKENEGIFAKITKWFREIFHKLFKLQWIAILISLTGVIISAIQLTKRDAGDIIEEIYQQTLTDVSYTEKYIAMVQLPDSLENLEEAEKLRDLQNDILKHKLASYSLFKEIRSYNWGVSNTAEQKELLTKSTITADYIILLTNLHKNINDRFTDLAEHWAYANDSLTMYSISLDELKKANINAEKFNQKQKECIAQLQKYSKKKNRESYALDVISVLYSSNELFNLFVSLSDVHLNMLNTINIRLLNIQNKATINLNPKSNTDKLDNLIGKGAI